MNRALKRRTTCSKLRTIARSGEVRRVPVTLADFDLGIRVALDHAMQQSTPIVALLRGDPMQGRASRAIEGIPLAYRPARDGRVRVLFLLNGGASQLVLVDRIVAVVRAAGSARAALSN